MPVRPEYRLMLPDWAGQPLGGPIPGTVREPSRSDASQIAELMLDAYRGTIDYDGETILEAIEEVEVYFSGGRGTSPWPHCSWLCIQRESVIAASLVSFWHERNAPLISYVMTRAAFKGRGYAGALLHRSLRSLAQSGQDQVLAVITDGNHPSERLFTRAGFERSAP